MIRLRSILLILDPDQQTATGIAMKVFDFHGMDGHAARRAAG